MYCLPLNNDNEDNAMSMFVRNILLIVMEKRSETFFEQLFIRLSRRRGIVAIYLFIYYNNIRTDMRASRLRNRFIIVRPQCIMCIEYIKIKLEKIILTHTHI